jgi:hypothetical protein
MDKVVVISENVELSNALKRAFKALADIEIVKNLRSECCVIFVLDHVKDFDSWLWGEFRMRKKALNPLIVIGTDEEDVFISRNPLFSTIKDQHTYFQIPFDLQYLLDVIKQMKPIHDQDTRRLIVCDFSKGYEHRLVMHDFKIIKGDNKQTRDHIETVRNFYKDKGDVVTVRFIENKLKEMESNEAWNVVACELKAYLEEKMRLQENVDGKNTLH